MTLHRTLFLCFALFAATAAVGQLDNPEPASCGMPLTQAGTCSEGALGDVAAESFASLDPAEIDVIVKAAASAINVNSLTIAVVDRAGRPLALFRKPGANPANDLEAIGVARTAAFFSHNMAPLSSRTVRFISGIHFPPGVTNTPQAALYGIENTNRGCDFNVPFNEGKCLPRARSLEGLPCNAFDTSGCGLGIVTGKVQPDDRDFRAVNAGGIPLYRVVGNGADDLDEGRVSNGKMIGAVGVVGAEGDPQIEEFAAADAAFGAFRALLARAPGGAAIIPVPQYPLPAPGNVFVDGVRLPFLGPDLKLRFDDNVFDGRIPVGIERPDDFPGAASSADGMYVIEPRFGGCAPNEYLVGPRAGSRLSAQEVDTIVQRSIAAAKRTRGLIRLPLNSYARMVIAVADVDGTILALYRMPDATIFSIDVALAKSRNVVYFSSNDPLVRQDLPGVPPGTSITNRTLNFGSQPFYPAGIDSRVFQPRTGPFFATLFMRDLERPCSQGSQLTNPNQSGIVFFPGATALYRNGQLIGGLGISGDGVEQDDFVTFNGAQGFLPERRIWADRVIIDGARLPMYKFPRHPEGVKECGGGPCS